VSLFSFFFFDVRDLAPFVSKDVTSTARRRVVDAALFLAHESCAPCTRFNIHNTTIGRVRILGEGERVWAGAVSPASGTSEKKTITRMREMNTTRFES